EERFCSPLRCGEGLGNGFCPSVLMLATKATPGLPFRAGFPRTGPRVATPGRFHYLIGDGRPLTSDLLPPDSHATQRYHPPCRDADAAQRGSRSATSEMVSRLPDRRGRSWRLCARDQQRILRDGRARETGGDRDGGGARQEAGAGFRRDR